MPLAPPSRLPGISHAVFEGQLPGQPPNLLGNMRPSFKSRDILNWLNGQIEWANKYRSANLELLKERRRKGKSSRHKRRRGRSNRGRKRGRSSDDSRSRSRSVSSSSSSHIEGKGHDNHRFRRWARERPGFNFASHTSDVRQQLGQRGMDHDVGQRGPVFRKWFDSCLSPVVGAAKIGPRASELHLLVSVLDEFMQGRVMEVGDMLASRLRY